MDLSFIHKMILPHDLEEIFNSGVEVIIPESREHLLELAMGNKENLEYDVSFDVPEKGAVREANIVRCKNGIVVNYDDIYMRRRDPDSMLIADDHPTDKPTYKGLYGKPFTEIRKDTLNWLKDRPSLLVMPFLSGAGGMGLGYPSLLVVPTNAAFFALALCDLQGIIPKDKIPNLYKPKAVVYVAPPFRHSHFDGKQIVVHNRQYEMHEVFSYNLYPGPSAKKGIYSVLLNIGEQEKWVTLHASTVTIVTAYELALTIMHEGASGGGKSEMIEQFHREPDGRMLLGKNIVTGEKYFLNITDTSELHPVTDDMALCHPSLQNNSNKLVVADAEDGWFLRVNHITEYGTEPITEKRTIHPSKPLVFLNMQGVPNSTCLLWEHTMDEPGKPCPNPRVIMPRDEVENSVKGEVEVDVRSFGIRQPPSTRENPNYGIVGMFHVLPPALAWLWRLAAPRGFANPSIIETGVGMKSEGVGSYWPFATGKMVDQANLLLSQIQKTLSTRYVLIPNQHIGAYQVGFSGQWASREYLSRRGGAKFHPEQLTPSRCPLLGYSLKSIKLDGTEVSKVFLQVNLQPEVGNDGYDAGAKILYDFFKKEISKFNTDDLQPLGKKIIEACLDGATVEDYYNLIPKI